MRRRRWKCLHQCAGRRGWRPHRWTGRHSDRPQVRRCAWTFPPSPSRRCPAAKSSRQSRGTKYCPAPWDQPHRSARSRRRCHWSRDSPSRRHRDAIRRNRSDLSRRCRCWRLRNHCRSRWSWCRRPKWSGNRPPRIVRCPQWDRYCRNSMYRCRYRPSCRAGLRHCRHWSSSRCAWLCNSCCRMWTDSTHGWNRHRRHSLWCCRLSRFPRWPRQTHGRRHRRIHCRDWPRRKPRPVRDRCRDYPWTRMSHCRRLQASRRKCNSRQSHSHRSER